MMIQAEELVSRVGNPCVSPGYCPNCWICAGKKRSIPAWTRLDMGMLKPF